jgi:hypothetical protein
MPNQIQYDETGKPIEPEFRHGSGFQKEKKWYQAAKRNYDAGQLVTGQTQGNASNVLSGTAKEQAGQLAGLNVSALGYGQSLGETGSDIQRIRELQKNYFVNVRRRRKGSRWRCS